MALRTQMRKASSGPSPESLLSQLSGYNRAETHSVDGGRSEASRVLGTRSCLLCQLLTQVNLSCIDIIFVLYSRGDVVSFLAVYVHL